MAPVQPPAYVQGGSFSARADRLLLAALLPAQRDRGVISSRCGVFPSGAGNDGMKVIARPTPDKWVRVTGGVCAVWPDDATGGTFIVHNDGAYDVRVPDAHPTLPRVDLVVVHVYDASDDEGDRSDWDIEVVQGAAGSNPQAPPTPPSCLALAEVTVPAAATSIPGGRINDVRRFITAAGGILPMQQGFGTALPQPAMALYRLDQRQLYLYDGDRWSGVFDDHYSFPYGTLAWKTADPDPDRVIPYDAEASDAAIMGGLTTTFTMPPNVPPTRAIYVFLTLNIELPSYPNTNSTRISYRLYLDGAPWGGRPGRRLTIPIENTSHQYLEHTTDFYAPPAAGTHTVQLRLWVDQADNKAVASWTWGSIAIALL